MPILVQRFGLAAVARCPDLEKRLLQYVGRFQTKDMENYRHSLPIEVQQVLEEHESNGTTDSEQYQEAAYALLQPVLFTSAS